MSEPFDVHLQGRFGDPLRHLAVTDSTNAQALSWAAEGAPEGAVVVADEQTAGRGRHGRRWDAGSGRNLLFSVVLRPRLAPQRLGLLTLAAGVGAARAIEEVTGVTAALKWPNDVLLSGRKVAGILAEGTLTGAEIRAAVVGIGINTHWTEDEIPDELTGRTTSLAIEMGERTTPPRAVILTAVLVQFERAYDLVHGDPEEVLAEARARCLLLGEAVRVTWPDGRSVSGLVTEIRGDGALEVLVDGVTQAIHAADIERIEPGHQT